MRQTIRYPEPTVLQNISTSAISNVTQTGKANNSIYAHQDVISSLHAMYKKKCFLCEMRVTNGEVEHFLPYDKINPQRAYDWKNLHWSCTLCNRAKKKNKYKQIDMQTNSVKNTLLIDPSAPIASIESLIKFNSNFEAETIPGPYQNQIEITSTVQFLNENNLPYKRNAVYTTISDYIILKIGDKQCFDDLLRKVLRKPSSCDPTLGPIRKKSTKNIKALEFSHNLYTLYLDDNADYSVSMKWAIESKLNFPVDAIKLLGRFWCKYSNVTPGY